MPTDRITDEQIAEWGTWVDGVLMDAGVDITPMLDALVAERERADQAQALAAWFAAEHEFWIKQHIEAGALETLRIKLECVAGIAVVEDIWPTIRTYVYGVFDKGFARGRAVEVESRKALNHG